MRSKSSQDRLVHIRDNILLAQRFIGQMTYAELREDVRTLYAVIRCLEIISEASRGVHAAVKARHPQLPWIDMAGAGNIYRHDYENVREVLVWKTVKDALPVLLGVVEEELKR